MLLTKIIHILIYHWVINHVLTIFTSKKYFFKEENNYVVFDADNQSDHNVIVLLLYTIPSHLFVPTTSHNSSINCNWSKAAQADIQSYQNCLNSYPDMIDISGGYLNCNYPHCTNVLHRRFIEVYCHSIIKLGIIASSVSILLVRHNVQRVPERTEHVKKNATGHSFGIGYG